MAIVIGGYAHSIRAISLRLSSRRSSASAASKRPCALEIAEADVKALDAGCAALPLLQQDAGVVDQHRAVGFGGPQLGGGGGDRIEVGEVAPGAAEVGRGREAFLDARSRTLAALAVADEQVHAPASAREALGGGLADPEVAPASSARWAEQTLDKLGTE
ncbi:MAG TPA: hypothetical protein VHR88_07060 [Solirubrobacteraceae bacterium]|nr:hypothetical protein [Solirubrobacteraceae bacterium]